MRIARHVNFLALAGAIPVFTTGLVLFTQFHVGEGSLRASAWGLGRLTWVNLHRIAALLTIGATAVHVYLHWRAIVMRVRRAKASRPDLVLYFGSAAVALTGAVAWWLLPGSPPIFGPVTLTHLARPRHLCIDIHNLSALALMPAAFIHVRRHFGWLLRPQRKESGK